MRTLRASVALPFVLQAPYSPGGDQPTAIKGLVESLASGRRDQTLLGVTGSGKTFTMANVIVAKNKPTLIISHNKTLAAQLYEEFREFFPDHAVCYWVSYFDYYQPEAYVPSKDLYIAKESDRNEEIEKMRHATTQALMTRDDVIVIASVSCIYGMGDPKEYRERNLLMRVGDEPGREAIMRRLVEIYYKRNDQAPDWGTFRARGDVLEVRSPDGESAYRIDFFGDEIESLSRIDPLTREVVEKLESVVIHPAQHFVTAPDELERVAQSIEREAEVRLEELRRKDMFLEAQRLEQRTKHDMEMLRELGYCSGIENYSRHFSGKRPGEAPYTLLDYFPDDFLTILDESHVTVPQIRGMFNGDRARKQVLVDHGFRLPSAVDNRPLKFDEFRKRTDQTVFVSATPGPYELEHTQGAIFEQVVRPTGLLDPVIEIRPSSGQVDDLLGELRERAARNERVLVTTLTKKMAEDLTTYYATHGVRVRYLHADVTTLERVDLLEDLRSGVFDVLVGINLLREGLDLPEVSLVAIFDADQEGFLRSETSLVQTFGRAARNVNGKVICYADKMTGSLERAIAETDRRREKQRAHNEAHGVTPQTIVKALRQMRDRKEKEVEARIETADADSLEVLVTELEGKMRAAAKRLDFETAAMYRDKIRELRTRLEDEKSA